MAAQLQHLLEKFSLIVVLMVLGHYHLQVDNMD
jgi:hypothetical protein